jgi:hypothetical protein
LIYQRELPGRQSIIVGPGYEPCFLDEIHDADALEVLPDHRLLEASVVSEHFLCVNLVEDALRVVFILTNTYSLTSLDQILWLLVRVAWSLAAANIGD